MLRIHSQQQYLTPEEIDEIRLANEKWLDEELQALEGGKHDQRGS